MHRAWQATVRRCHKDSDMTGQLSTHHLSGRRNLPLWGSLLCPREKSLQVNLTRKQEFKKKRKTYSRHPLSTQIQLCLKLNLF